MALLSSLANFMGGMSAAMLVKLTSSMDDVLWLSAFLTPKLSRQTRLQNALVYAAVCVLQTILAYMFSTMTKVGMERIMGQDTAMSPERMLTLIAGVAMSVYAIVLGVEYYKERNENDEKVEYSCVESEDRTDSSNDSICDCFQESQGDSVARTERPSASDKPCQDDVEVARAIAAPLEMESHGDIGKEQEHACDKRSPSSLALVAFLGSLDDLTLFVPMLVGNTFGIVQLVVGALISTLGILSICVCLTSCQVIADALEKIPLVTIVAGFSLFLLVKGMFFMD